MSTNPITPELALVDPDHARIARQLLPDRSYRTATPARPAILEPAADVPAAARSNAPQHRLRLKAALTGALFATLIGATASCLVAVSLVLHTDEQPGAARVDAPLEGSPTNQLREAPQTSWPAIPGARSYHIMLTRNGTLIYDTTTQHAKVALPVRLRLAPGRYTWTVTPNPGNQAEISRPLVMTTFQIPTQ